MSTQICIILSFIFCLAHCNPVNDEQALCLTVINECRRNLTTFNNNTILLEFKLLPVQTYNTYCALVAAETTCINARRSNCTNFRQSAFYAIYVAAPSYTCSDAGRTVISSLNSSVCARNSVKQEETMQAVLMCLTNPYPATSDISTVDLDNNGVTDNSEMCKFQRQLDRCRIQAATTGCGAAYGRFINKTLEVHNTDTNTVLLTHCT